MAGKQLTNPMGAFPVGTITVQDELYLEVAPSQASAAITAGRACAIGTTGLVAHAATNGTASLVIGIAASDIASGFAGDIIIQGIASGFADGTIAAGDILKRSTNTAGYVMTTATPGVGESIGVAIAASASGRVDMWVAKGV